MGLCLALIVGGCGGAPVEGDSPPTTHAGVPVFQASDLTGEVFDLADHIGKDVVFISFWATWCEPCKTEMPLLQRLHDDYSEKGLKVLSVSLDGPETVAGVEPYIQTQGYTFQVVIDEDTSIAQSINPRTVAPFTVILGRDGQVAKTIVSEMFAKSLSLLSFGDSTMRTTSFAATSRTIASGMVENPSARSVE